MMVGGVVSVIQTFSVSPGSRTNSKQVSFPNFQQGNDQMYTEHTPVFTIPHHTDDKPVTSSCMPSP